MQEEKLFDVKGTFEKFIKADEPEMSQEEAISKFEDINMAIKKIANSSSGEDQANSEEQEHLQRIKQELLASLKRVEELEKQIYGSKEEKETAKSKLKVSQGGKGKSQRYQEIEQKQNSINEKERE